MHSIKGRLGLDLPAPSDEAGSPKARRPILSRSFSESSGGDKAAKALRGITRKGLSRSVSERFEGLEHSPVGLVSSSVRECISCDCVSGGWAGGRPDRRRERGLETRGVCFVVAAKLYRAVNL